MENSIDSLLSELRKSAAFSAELTTPMAQKKIGIREMTLKDQMDVIKGIQVFEGDKPEVKYSEMLNRMITKPEGFEVKTLPSEDITYLLIYNKIMTTGPVVNMAATCQHKSSIDGEPTKPCGKVNAFTYDLIESRVLDRIEEALKDAYPFEVESEDYTVTMGILSEQSEMKIQDNLESYIAMYYKEKEITIDKLKKEAIDMITMVLMCAARVISIKKGETVWDIGSEDLDKKVEVFLALGGKVSLAVLEKLKDRRVETAGKIIDTIEVQCEDCENKISVMVNMMDKSFFVGRF